MRSSSKARAVSHSGDVLRTPTGMQQALSFYWCMRLEAPSVCGLKLLVYAAVLQSGDVLRTRTGVHAVLLLYCCCAASLLLYCCLLLLYCCFTAACCDDVLRTRTGMQQASFTGFFWHILGLF